MSEWNLELARIAKQATYDVLAFVFLYVLVGLICWRKDERAILWGVGGVILLLSCYTCAWTPELISAPLIAEAKELKARSAQSGCQFSRKTLVVLGGGNFGEELLTAISQSRVIEAAKIVKQFSQESKKFTIVLAGGKTRDNARVAEAQVLKRHLLLELGSAGGQHQIFLEAESKNTNDNADNVKKLLQQKKQSLQIILVTSQLHMPRAYATFLKKGFNVCPWPAESAELKTEGLASFYAGSLTAAVLNEYLGIWGYRLRGWL